MQTRATPDAIGRDVKNVVNEAQELLKTVQTEGSNRIDEVKSKVTAQYEQARESKFLSINTSLVCQSSAAPERGVGEIPPSTLVEFCLKKMRAL